MKDIISKNITDVNAVIDLLRRHDIASDPWNTLGLLETERQDLVKDLEDLQERLANRFFRDQNNYRR